MKPFTYFIKYLISFELKFSLIAICSNKACIVIKILHVSKIRVKIKGTFINMHYK